MRSDNLYMIIDCVPSDLKSPSGHKHNSRLSFELFAYDKSFIIDPGAYIYTADKEMRNLFRSTRYHNTAVVDGQEQNRFNKDSLFSIGQDAGVKINKWEETDNYSIIDAEHTGYRRLESPAIHRRRVLFNKEESYWIIKDILTGDGTHEFAIYFHFAPIEVELDIGLPLAVKTRVAGANLAVIPLETEGISLEIFDGWVSYRYGVKINAPVVKYIKTGHTPISFCNIIYPYTGTINIKEVIERVKASKLPENLMDN